MTLFMKNRDHRSCNWQWRVINKIDTFKLWNNLNNDIFIPLLIKILKKIMVHFMRLFWGYSKMKYI